MDDIYRCTNCQGEFPADAMSDDVLTCRVCAGLEVALGHGEDLRLCADCGAEYDALTFPHGHPCEPWRTGPATDDPGDGSQTALNILRDPLARILLTNEPPIPDAPGRKERDHGRV